MAKPFQSREVIARVNMQMMIGKKRRELERSYLERTAELDTIAKYSPVGIARTTLEGESSSTASPPRRIKDGTDFLIANIRLVLLLQCSMVRG